MTSIAIMLFCVMRQPSLTSGTNADYPTYVAMKVMIRDSIKVCARLKSES